MKTGTRKGHKVKIYEDGDKFIIEFSNGASITVDDLSEIKLDK